MMAAKERVEEFTRGEKNSGVVPAHGGSLGRRECHALFGRRTKRLKPSALGQPSGPFCTQAQVRRSRLRFGMGHS